MTTPPSNLPPTQNKEEKFALVKEKRGKLAIKGAIWSTVNSATPTLLSSLVFIITSRYLMPHDFGIVALSVSIVSFASALTPGALGDALIQKFSISAKLLDTVFWIGIISAFVAFILLTLLARPIALHLEQPQLQFLIPIVAVKLIFDLASIVPNALISRSMSFHLIATRTIIATVLSSSICISLLFLGYGILALAISLVTTSIINCIVTFWSAHWHPRLHFATASLKEVGKFTLFASGNRLLQLMSLDQILLGSLVSPAALGIYNFSKRIYQMLHDVLVGSLNSVCYSLMASMQNEQEKVRETFLLATFSSSMIAIPAFTGLALIAEDLIPFVFGEHWVEAIRPTQWFCIFGLMSCIGVMQSSLINSQGKNDWWFYYQLFKQLMSITTIFLMKDYSIGTIVMTLTLQTVAVWPITLMMVTKIIKMKLSNYFSQFLGPLTAGTAMFLSILLVEHYLSNIHPIYLISAKIISGGLVYTTTAIALEHKRIKSIVGFIKKRRE